MNWLKKLLGWGKEAPSPTPTVEEVSRQQAEISVRIQRIDRERQVLQARRRHA